MPDGVIFDMDGVLVDSGPAHHESWQMLAKKHGLDVSAERFHQTFGRTSRNIIRTIWGESTSDEQVRGLDEEKEAIYRELIRNCVPLMPGGRELLIRLLSAGLVLAVATSGPPENMKLVLSEELIANYFEATVHGFEIARGKPAPDCFLLAAERLNLPPSSCVVIEDAPVGIESARAAGMPTIALAGTHPTQVLKAAGAAHVVQRLEEITLELVTQTLSAM